MPAHRVPNANIPPRNAVGYLMMQWSTGFWAAGSAALLNDQYLLTCSHNLVDAITDPPPLGHATQILFYPGYNQARPATPPPGGLPVQVGFYTNNFAAGEDAWDVAVCRLAAPLANPPPFYFTPTVTGAGIVGEDVVLTGYPGQFRGEMWEDNDEVAGVDVPTNTILYTNDTWPGDSGAPVWTYDAVEEVVHQHAIHVSRQEQELRRGLLITQAVYDWIQGALAAPVPGGAGLQLVGR